DFSTEQIKKDEDVIQDLLDTLDDICNELDSMKPMVPSVVVETMESIEQVSNKLEMKENNLVVDCDYENEEVVVSKRINGILNEFYHCNENKSWKETIRDTLKMEIHRSEHFAIELNYLDHKSIGLWTLHQKTGVPWKKFCKERIYRSLYILQILAFYIKLYFTHLVFS